MEAEASLAELIARRAPEAGMSGTCLPDFYLARRTSPMPPRPVLYEPSICVVAAGRKEARLGGRTLVYDETRYLLCTLTLPIESTVPEASEEAPFLGVVLRIDPAMVGQLLVEMDPFMRWPERAPEGGAMCSVVVDPGFGRLASRLVRASDNPMDARILGPALLRELYYRVLCGPNGHVLRDCVLRDGHVSRVARAVRFIEQRFAEPLSVDRIAHEAGMSASALHEHFKQATSLSPMQFVKKLRLHHAHTLLLGGAGSGEVAFEVGYNSPSQFSREFKRLFGVSPSAVHATA